MPVGCPTLGSKGDLFPLCLALPNLGKACPDIVILCCWHSRCWTSTRNPEKEFTLSIQRDGIGMSAGLGHPQGLSSCDGSDGARGLWGWVIIPQIPKPQGQAGCWEQNLPAPREPAVVGTLSEHPPEREYRHCHVQSGIC